MKQNPTDMKSICTFVVLVCVLFFTSCENSAGPENDPQIKIETTFTKPDHRVSILHKTCTFQAIVVEDQLKNENRIKVRPISDTWDEEFWVHGSASGWIPSLKTPEGARVTIAGYTAIRKGGFIWNYFIIR